MGAKVVSISTTPNLSDATTKASAPQEVVAVFMMTPHHIHRVDSLRFRPPLYQHGVVIF